MNEKDWKKLQQPPEWALKKITGGRLQGMTDIKPQWRIAVMNEVFGVCGDGWKFEIVDYRQETGSEGQVFAFAHVCVYYKTSGSDWSEAVPGIGGSMLVSKEKSGLYNNDEAYKMAVTDALSSALKMIGVAQDIYMGNWNGSKYVERKQPNEAKPSKAAKPKNDPLIDYKMLISNKGMTENEVNDFENWACNIKKESDFQKLIPKLVDNFDTAYKKWMESRL